MHVFFFQISITVIPLAKWNIQYIQPAFHCRMYNKSCVSTSYDIPPDAIQLAAFSRRIQDKVPLQTTIKSKNREMIVRTGL